MAVFDSQTTQVVHERPVTPLPILQPFQSTPTTQTHEVHMRYLQTRWTDSFCLEEPLTPSYGRALLKYNKFSATKILSAQLMKEREIKKARNEQDRMRRKSGSN